MSVTRIFCEICGFPLSWCECKKSEKRFFKSLNEKEQINLIKDDDKDCLK